MKAIETVYNNYRFRSRLEARHAVFFDTLGIKWEYEKEGYDLYGTHYLPDFWLPGQDCFVEIKGQEPTRAELDKANLLALASGKKVYIFFGTIEVPKTEDEVPGDWWHQAPLGFDPSDRSIIGDDTASSCYQNYRDCPHGDNCPSRVELHIDDNVSKAIYVAEVLHSPGDSIKYQLDNDGKLQFLVPRHDGINHRFGRFSQPLPPIIRDNVAGILRLIRTKPNTWEWGVGGTLGILSPDHGSFWSECSNCMLLLPHFQYSNLLYCYEVALTMSGSMVYI